VLNVKFKGLVINRQPKISVLFEVKALKLSKIVSFLVDTGTSYSGITEKEAALIGIHVPTLPYAKDRAIGFGGFFRNKMINREVVLTFNGDEGEHKINCGGGFTVILIPPNLSAEEREKLIRLTPNVLGMDVLKRFKTVVEENRVELILEEK
jgi:hypothetical protein